jgi:hypothetical protein
MLLLMYKYYILLNNESVVFKYWEGGGIVNDTYTFILIISKQKSKLTWHTNVWREENWKFMIFLGYVGWGNAKHLKTYF